MKSATLPIPELGIIAATRGMLAAGVALLLADRIPLQKRKRIAVPLIAIGVLTTVPLLLDVAKRTNDVN